VTPIDAKNPKAIVQTHVTRRWLIARCIAVLAAMNSNYLLLVVKILSLVRSINAKFWVACKLCSMITGFARTTCAASAWTRISLEIRNFLVKMAPSFAVATDVHLLVVKIRARLIRSFAESTVVASV
jgi:hypothetical protein